MVARICGAGYDWSRVSKGGSSRCICSLVFFNISLLCLGQASDQGVFGILRSSSIGHVVVAGRGSIAAQPPPHSIIVVSRRVRV